MKLNQADSTTDDLEPLFDYRRVQPLNIVCLDDDCSDTSPVPSPKRRKFANPDGAEVVLDKDVEVIKVVNVEEEDWLAPPPVVSTKAYSKIGEDSTIKELRRRKQELLSFAQSAKSMLQEVEESAKQEPSGSSKPSLDAVAEQPKNPAPERAKIVISIQNKDEIKQFRIYMDDKFEKLFSLYANKAKLDLQSLVFSFDGDKINLAATPASLGMEDDDIVEVHEKKS
ncbi:hypothetical protein CXB51_010433 [Gossypium anomalum]|uniref:Rad60/SUMO-like domain-containing protein n=1 Tax=Gossypium anomalum TaxID=47600 RepID=A0A8J6CZE8_9ROSI|nr:hypothetical protein CXB51_010433 [Gossypium anomalum]